MRKYLIIHFLITSIALSIAIPSYLILSSITENTTHILLDADSEENAEEFELKIVQFDTLIFIYKEVKLSLHDIYVFRYFSCINTPLESPPPEI